MEAGQRVAPRQAERNVSFRAADGWRIRGTLQIPEGKTRFPGVALLHGSRHESDAYGNASSPGLPQSLNELGMVTLRIDIRGRGASREPLPYCDMAPGQRQAVRLDVDAAINFLASQRSVDARRLGVVVEQDTAQPALPVVRKDRRVLACVMISGRLDSSRPEPIRRFRTPVFCIVSKEDRRGFHDMVDVYLASASKQSRLKVFKGMPLGTTMFSAWRYEFPNEKPIEDLIAEWLSGNLVRGKM